MPAMQVQNATPASTPGSKIQKCQKKERFSTIKSPTKATTKDAYSTSSWESSTQNGSFPCSVALGGHSPTQAKMRCKTSENRRDSYRSGIKMPLRNDHSIYRRMNQLVLWKTVGKRTAGFHQLLFVNCWQGDPNELSPCRYFSVLWCGLIASGSHRW